MPGAATEEACRFLEWDSRFFGMKIGRVNSSRLVPETVVDVVNWCRTHNIKCLYLLASAEHEQTHQLAAQNNFRLVDIRVTLENSSLGPAGAGVSRNPALHTSAGQDQSQSSPSIRTFEPADLPALREMAGRLHRETRFFVDPGFPQERSEELYRVWLEKSCVNAQGKVLVAAATRKLFGYLTCSLTESGDG